MTASANVSEEMQFRLGAVGNFPIVASHFKEICINFGVPGQEIIQGVRIPLPVPEKSAKDAHGFVYGHEVEKANDGSLLRDTNGDIVFSRQLTDNGERAFLQDLSYYRTQLVLREQHHAGLMVTLLRWLSPASKNALDVDPAYTTAKNLPDTFAVWGMVTKVHQFGSSRTKFQFLLDFLFNKQDGRSFDAYVVDLNRKSDLVVGAFNSAAHPGFICLDLLKKLIFMQGVDKVFYAKVLDKLLDDKPLATSAEAIEDCHAYALERGSTSLPSNSSGSKVYVVQLPPPSSSRQEVRLFTQTHPCPAHMCPRCWANGFGDSSVNAHVVASCPWIRGPSTVPVRVPARVIKPVAKQPSSSIKALVAAVPSVFLESPAVPSFNAEHMYELMMAEHARRTGLVAPVSSPAAPSALTCVISDQVMADILAQEALLDAAVALPVVADVSWMSAFLELERVLDQQAASVSGPPSIAVIPAPSLFPSSFDPMSILLAQEAALDSVDLSPASSVVAAVVPPVVSPVSPVYAGLLGGSAVWVPVPLPVVPVLSVLSVSSAAGTAVVSRQSTPSLQTLIPPPPSPAALPVISVSTVASSAGFSAVISRDSAGS